MKSIYVLLLILAATKVQAQDTELINNTWYLQNLIINGNDNIPTSNSEVSSITANFYLTEFFTSICDALSGSIVYDDNINEFNLNAGLTFDGCSNQINTDFQLLYLENFYFNNMSNPFVYSIQNEGNGSQTLIVNNSTGNQAIYTSDLLSVQEFSNSSINIHPNPFENVLYISELSTLQNLRMTIFDISGRQVLKTNNKIIEVQKLNSGIYFILLNNEQGRSIIKKLIKR